MEETTKIWKDGQKVEVQLSDLEKAVFRKYPNLSPVVWEMVKNVNLVMKIMLGIFIVQAVGLVLFILSQVY